MKIRYHVYHDKKRPFLSAFLTFISGILAVLGGPLIILLLIAVVWSDYSFISTFQSASPDYVLERIFCIIGALLAPAAVFCGLKAIKWNTPDEKRRGYRILALVLFLLYIALFVITLVQGVNPLF